MKSFRNVRGVSLIEVLVALLIIAVGVLGAVALQVRAVQSGMESHQRTQALIFVEDMVARVKNNKQLVSTCYAAIGRGTPSYVGSGVTSALSECNDLADEDIKAWHNLLLGAAEAMGADAQAIGGILNARGCIDPLVANGEYRISVAWQGLSKITSADAGGKNPCAKGSYADEDLRRVVGVVVRITDLR